jgi:peptidoglycan/LPS O-acetylase OafA/YrhL
VWATLSEAAFLQNYHYGLWGHTWSLAIEEHFYILLVVALTSIVAVSRSPSRVLERIFIAVPIVVLALRIATHFLLPFQHHTHHWPTHLRIDSLLFGVSLAYLEHLKPARFAALLQWRIPIVCVGVLGLIPPLFLPADHPFVHTIGYTLLYLGYGSVLIFALGQPPARFRWSRAVLRWTAALGAYSYSIYLWHVPFSGWIMPTVTRAVPGPFLVTVALYCVGAGLAGVLLARLVEFPVLRLRDRLFPSRVDAAATPTASVPDAPPALT